MRWNIRRLYRRGPARLNRRGKLVTLEGGAALAEVARRNFAALSRSKAWLRSPLVLSTRPCWMP